MSDRRRTTAAVLHESKKACETCEDIELTKDFLEEDVEDEESETPVESTEDAAEDTDEEEVIEIEDDETDVEHGPNVAALLAYCDEYTTEEDNLYKEILEKLLPTLDDDELGEWLVEAGYGEFEESAESDEDEDEADESEETEDEEAAPEAEDI